MSSLYRRRSKFRIRLGEAVVTWLLWSPYAPVSLSLMLLFLPYLFYNVHTYQNIGLFIIIPLVGKFQHFIFCFGISLVMLTAVFFAKKVANANKNAPKLVSLRFSPITRLLIYFIIAISILSHIYLLITSGSAYVEGGLLDARDKLANGVGIFLRLYMFSLPFLFFCISRRRAWAVVAIVGVLVLMRAYVISERVAVLEFISTVIVIMRITNFRVKITWVIVGIISIYFAFSFTATVRLLQQNSANQSLVAQGAARTDVSVVAYYADAMNKAYFAMEHPGYLALYNWAAPIRALSGEQVIDPIYYFAVVANGIGSSELNNPGGPAQDLEDFGFVGFWIVLFAKTWISAFIFEMSRFSYKAVGLFPLFFIRTIEYPRFEYFSFPYATYVLFMAMIILFFMPVTLFYRRINTEAR